MKRPAPGLNNMPKIPSKKSPPPLAKPRANILKSDDTSEFTMDKKAHLATSTGLYFMFRNKEFTEKQLLKFQKIALTFEKHVKQSMLKHILNSHGVINFPEYQLDIVRLGIGLYGSATIYHDNNFCNYNHSCLHPM